MGASLEDGQKFRSGGGVVKQRTCDRHRLPINRIYIRKAPPHYGLGISAGLNITPLMPPNFVTVQYDSKGHRARVLGVAVLSSMIVKKRS